jgi:hypothetical protein
MMIADAVDSKQLYEDVIKDFYEWGNNLRLNGLPASDKTHVLPGIVHGP